MDKMGILGKIIQKLRGYMEVEEMVYWRIETDYVALAIYVVLFIKAALLNKQKNFTDQIFSLALILGFLSTCIDIYSSAMMNDSMSWWAYEISMLIYGLSVPVLALFWFLYTISLIFRNDAPRAKRIDIVFLILYAIYAAVILTNPIHELYFHLSADIVYSRGDWFLPLLVGSQTFLSAAGVLMVLCNRRRIPPGRSFSCCSSSTLSTPPATTSRSPTPAG